MFTLHACLIFPDDGTENRFNDAKCDPVSSKAIILLTYHILKTFLKEHLSREVAFGTRHSEVGL